MTESEPSRVTLERPDQFGGPVGAFLLTVLTPLITVYLWLCIHRSGGALWIPHRWADFGQLPQPTWRAAGMLSIWVALQLVLHVISPGKRQQGFLQRDGRRLPYRVNGWVAFLLSMGLLVALFVSRVVDPWMIIDELGALLMVSIIASFVLGVWLYAHGRIEKSQSWRSGHFFYDYFMGTGLNPRIGWFDFKFFFESRIGMGTWGALVVTMLAADYLRDGTVSLPMALACGFQLFYILDFFWLESAMLSTWDIVRENFGYMLSHAFFVWMPFNFTLQPQYLLSHTPNIGIPAAIALCALHLGGYFIFRTTNLQKHQFRTDPTAAIWGKAPSYIRTKRGTLLLTAGWWGVARHINYLGDLMMAAAWCLTCGFSHIVPYFYFIYFAPLLINRERRDNAACQTKYGEDWDAYCQKVPWRMVPWIY